MELGVLTRPTRTALSRWIVTAYGTGHMLNDLTSACWFTYLLIFLTDIGLSPQQAASVMMAGQLADAVATLVTGRLIDAFGHYKLWHAGGSVLTALSFSSVFGGCLVCSLSRSNSTALATASYSVFAAVFNCGWAATQVSHMAMVNCMTCNPSSQVALNSCRNAFTMVANLTLYGLAFLAFLWLPASSPAQVKWQFRWIAAGAVAIGLLFITIFYLCVPEPRPRRACASSPGAVRHSWAYWLRQLQYYQVGAVYTLTRLICNVSQAMLPFFLIYDLNMPQSAKAVIPGVVFVFSFGVSLFLQEMCWTARRLKASYAVGALLWVLSSGALFLVDYRQRAVLYGVAAVIGAANALILVSATSMEGVLVGQRLDGCAFVYGSLSFFDKISSGIALFAIEATNRARPFCGGVSASCPRTSVRWVLTLLPFCCAVLATLVAVGTRLEESEAFVAVIDSDDMLPRLQRPQVADERCNGT